MSDGVKLNSIPFADKCPKFYISNPNGIVNGFLGDIIKNKDGILWVKVDSSQNEGWKLLEDAESEIYNIQVEDAEIDPTKTGLIIKMGGDTVNDTKWEYAIPLKFFEMTDYISVEDLYQAFKERLIKDILERQPTELSEKTMEDALIAVSLVKNDITKK